MLDLNVLENGDASCWLCKKCNNFCCIFPLRRKKPRKGKYHNVFFEKSESSICLCDNHYNEFTRVKLLLNLLLEEKQNRECSQSI